VVSFIDRLGLAPCYLVGHSLGGGVSMSVALRYPDKVKGLMLLDPAPIDGLPLAEDSYARIEALRRHYGVLKRAIGGIMGARSGDRRLHTLLAREALLMNRDAYHTHAKAVADIDFREAARKHSVPTLVVWGAHDPIISREQAERTAEALHAQLKVVEHVGHSLIIEDPEAFKRIVLDFTGQRE
jgi:branched-chain amino acid transport system permease protein